LPGLPIALETSEEKPLTIERDAVNYNNSGADGSVIFTPSRQDS